MKFGIIAAIEATFVLNITRFRISVTWAVNCEVQDTCCCRGYIETCTNIVRDGIPGDIHSLAGWFALPKDVGPLYWVSDVLTELAVRWRAGSTGLADQDLAVGSSHAAALSA